MHQGVVRSDAGLPAAEELPPNDGGHGTVLHAALGDDGRGLAAKFERDGDEILARRLHHRSPHCGAPREDELIERQGGECSAVTADYGDLFFGEELAEHRREYSVRRRCELRRFEHDAVSRGDRGDHRHQRQVDGIVPRRDDADHTERLILDAIAAEPHVQGDAAARRAHEATEIAREVINALDDADDFHQRCLVA